MSWNNKILLSHSLHVLIFIDEFKRYLKNYKKKHILIKSLTLQETKKNRSNLDSVGEITHSNFEIPSRPNDTTLIKHFMIYWKNPKKHKINFQPTSYFYKFMWVDEFTFVMEGMYFFIKFIYKKRIIYLKFLFLALLFICSANSFLTLKKYFIFFTFPLLLLF